jgi:hypothetical protein
MAARLFKHSSIGSVFLGGSARFCVHKIVRSIEAAVCSGMLKWHSGSSGSVKEVG